MEKQESSRLLDLLTFLGFLFLSVTGFILRDQSSQGGDGWVGFTGNYYESRGDVSLLLGFSRWEWSELHFFIAIGLMVILAFYLCLHWSWIEGYFKKEQREASGFRFALGVIGLTALIITAVSPLWVNPEASQQHISWKSAASSNAPFQLSQLESMTFDQIHKKMQVPSEYLMRELNLPVGVPTNVSLEELGKSYNFTSQDVQKLISKYRKIFLGR